VNVGMMCWCFSMFACEGIGVVESCELSGVKGRMDWGVVCKAVEGNLLRD